MILSNASGAAVMAGTVDRATFCGPPLVAVGTNLGAWNGEPRWEALLAFIGKFTVGGRVAPLIGCTPNSIDEVAARCVSHGKFWRVSGTSPPDVAIAGPVRGVLTPYRASFLGPIICVPQTAQGVSTDRTAAIALSDSSFRAGDKHPFGIGMLATGHTSAPLTPPVYVMNIAGYAGQFEQLASLWLRPPRPTLAQQTTRCKLVELRPETYRHLHASLIGSPLLLPPV